MIKKKILEWLIFIFCIIGVAFISQHFFGNDNIIEEECEELIEKNTGYQIDLSPEDCEFSKYNWDCSYYGNQ